MIKGKKKKHASLFYFLYIVSDFPTFLIFIISQPQELVF